MRERVITAMHKVWADRCREICRDVEYGTGWGVLPSFRKARFIQIARSSARPTMIVGIWHVRPTGPGEHEIMNEKHFSPPIHVATLPKFYQILIDNVTEGLTWVHQALEDEAIR
jgi:hypothetical protein